MSVHSFAIPVTVVSKETDVLNFNLYVISAVTGELEDRQEWAVCGYYDRNLAQKHIDQANTRAKILKSAGFITSFSSDVPVTMQELDPHFKMADTGTYYFMRTVPIRDRLPR